MLIASVPVAVFRLLTFRPVWLFQRRRAAAGYLLAVIAVTIAALLAGGVIPSISLPTFVSAPGSAPAASPVLPTPQGTGAAPGSTGSEPSSQNVPGESPSVPDQPGPAADVSGAAPVATAPILEARPATAVPTVAPTTAPLPGRVAVGNTGGEGVALRRSARWADRWPGVAWPDRTVLTVLQHGVSGDDGAGGVTTWLRVRDPAGREGFVPARYTIPAG
jgi:hypothetical protein